MDDLEDSLFEGMVLFNPSSFQLPVKSPAANHNNNRVVEELSSCTIHRPSNHQQLPHPPSPATATTTATATAGASCEPLDENLFSDLTLIQPQSQDSFDSPPSSSHITTTTATATDVATKLASQTSTTLTTISSSGGALPQTQSITRQISTNTARKKKRAGLRIGYGRSSHFQDSTIDVEDKQPQLPPPSNSTSLSHSLSSSLPVPIVLEVKVEPGEENKQQAPPSTIALAAETTSELEQEQIKKRDDETRISEPISSILGKGKIPQEEEEEVGKENSYELRYDQLKAQISEKLNCARQAVVSLSAKRKDSIGRRRKAAEELSLASSKYKEMEKELEEAVESEDFETAERVSDSLASAEKNKELLSFALIEAEAECDSIDSKMQEVLELQIAAEEECAALLQSFAMDADHNADSVIANAEATGLEEMEKWLSLSEALEVKKMEAEIESHVLSEAQLVLDDSIKDTVKDDREESVLLHKKKEMLTGELEGLLALVKKKEAEIAENNLKIEKVEKRIADAISSFQNAQSSIHSKFDNLLLGLSELELDNEALSRKKKEIDDFLLQEEARGSKIRGLGRISADEAGMYQELINLRKGLMHFISKLQEDKARLATTEQKLSTDVQMLKQEISDVRASFQDLSSTKSGFQQAIESFKQRLLFTEKRAPELESEKRVAAAARNFKEAARIANETKTLYVEKESLQTKMEEAKSELKKIEEDINQNVNRLREKEVEISSKEKELAVVRYQLLLLVSGAATAERSAAIELGDLEEADALLKEAQAADAEAKKLQPTFSFREEEFDSVPKNFISMELISCLGGKQLVELAASYQIAAP